MVTPARFEKLKKAVMSYAAALTSGPGRWSNEEAVREQLAHHTLTTSYRLKPAISGASH